MVEIYHFTVWWTPRARPST